MWRWAGSRGPCWTGSGRSCASRRPRRPSPHSPKARAWPSRPAPMIRGSSMASRRHPPVGAGWRFERWRRAELVGRVADGTGADVERAVAAARVTFRAGCRHRMAMAEQVAIMKGIGDLLDRGADARARLETLQTGTSYKLRRESDFAFVSDNLRFRPADLADTRRARECDLRISRDLPQSPTPSLEVGHALPRSSSRLDIRPRRWPDFQYLHSTDPGAAQSLRRSQCGSEADIAGRLAPPRAPASWCPAAPHSGCVTPCGGHRLRLRCRARA